MAWLAFAGRAVGTVLRDPVIGILLLAGVAELAGDPLVDGLVLLTVAAALGWDRVRRRRSPGATDAPGIAKGVRRAIPADAYATGWRGQEWADRCCRLAAPACRWSEGDLVDARTHRERALAITESRLGGDHPETSAALSNLADVLSARATWTAPAPCTSAPWRSARAGWAPIIPIRAAVGR